jgi:hypothetical protein
LPSIMRGQSPAAAVRKNVTGKRLLNPVFLFDGHVEVGYPAILGIDPVPFCLLSVHGLKPLLPMSSGLCLRSLKIDRFQGNGFQELAQLKPKVDEPRVPVLSSPLASRSMPGDVRMKPVLYSFMLDLCRSL